MGYTLLPVGADGKELHELKVHNPRWERGQDDALSIMVADDEAAEEASIVRRTRRSPGRWTLPDGAWDRIFGKEA